MKKLDQVIPLGNREASNQLQIKLTSNSKGFDIAIIANGSGLQRPTSLTIDDLSDLNDSFRQKLDEITQICDDNKQYSPKEYFDLIYSLAEIGKYAYERIFSHEDIKRFLLDILLNNTEFIEIVSEKFCLPWEFIYPNNLINEGISKNNFWGAKYIIYRIIIGKDIPGNFLPLTITYENEPILGLLSNIGLGFVRKVEIPFFKRLNLYGNIHLEELSSLDPKDRAKGLTKFKSFFQKNLDIAHFACHAECCCRSPMSSFISLTDSFEIKISDFDAYEIVIKGNPVVIFNACECANMNPRYSNYFASTFLRRGVRGVIATECKVPDRFASEFAEKFYEYFLAGIPLGDSLFKARMYFLDKHNNPTGLIYSLYAPPMIRLSSLEGSKQNV